MKHEVSSWCRSRTRERVWRVGRGWSAVDCRVLKLVCVMSDNLAGKFHAISHLSHRSTGYHRFQLPGAPQVRKSSCASTAVLCDAHTPYPAYVRASRPTLIHETFWPVQLSTGLSLSNRATPSRAALAYRAPLLPYALLAASAFDVWAMRRKLGSSRRFRAAEAPNSSCLSRFT